MTAATVDEMKFARTATSDENAKRTAHRSEESACGTVSLCTVHQMWSKSGSDLQLWLPAYGSRRCTTKTAV